MVSRPFWLTEVDLALLFQFANELDHIERIDAERLERCLFGDKPLFNIEVFNEKFFDDCKRIHNRPFCLRVTCVQERI